MTPAAVTLTLMLADAVFPRAALAPSSGVGPPPEAPLVVRWSPIRRAPRAAVRGTLRGIVATVEPAAGRLVLDVGEGEVVLAGTPFQLASLRTGVEWKGDYAVLGDTRWLPPPLLACGDVARVFGVMGVVEGVVVAVDPVAGALTVDAGRRYELRGHPADIAALLPGELVRATYARVGATPWLCDVSVPLPAGHDGSPIPWLDGW